MKSLFITGLFFGLAITCVAQVSIEVKEVSANMSKGVNKGFETEIPGTSIRDVERDWKRRLTVGSKAKLSEANGEITVHGIDNKDIAAKPFNVFGILIATNEGVKLTAWFTYNDTVFFTNPSASLFVRDFARAEYYLAVKNLHQKERDKLEKLKDDLDRSVRVEERSEMKIADNKRLIARAQEDLVTNNEDQNDATTAINLQQAELNKDRNGNAELYKAAEKALQSLQDDKKKLQDKNQSLHKKIDEWNKEISNEEITVSNEKKTQGQSVDAIAKQKLLIQNLAVKLKTIK
jgi:hypothetical protein